MEIGADAVIGLWTEERDRLVKLPLIDPPWPGALENAAPTEIFASAAPAIGRTFLVIEQMRRHRRGGAAEPAASAMSVAAAATVRINIVFFLRWCVNGLSRQLTTGSVNTAITQIFASTCIEGFVFGPTIIEPFRA